LAVLTGRPPGALKPLLAEVRPIPNGPDVVGLGIPAELMRRRPDVRAAERILAASTALIGVSRAQLLPRLAISGSLDANSRPGGARSAVPDRRDELRRRRNPGHPRPGGVRRRPGRRGDHADPDRPAAVPRHDRRTRDPGQRRRGLLERAGAGLGHQPAQGAPPHRPGQDDDFNIFDTRQISETLTGTTNLLTQIVAAVAAISLLVGGIGIMNIMLVSVAERTREIGIRLAIGAISREVLTQFLVESVVLSCLGGIAGLVLAQVAILIATPLMRVPWTFDPSINVIAFGVSGLIGVVFGYFPARRAASLNPIDALRHE